MNKKILIGIIITITLIALISGGIFAYIALNKNKVKPEEIWNKYISYINEQKYEEMYEMLTQESKEQISQENFISRNKNIYSGIDMKNMKIEITNIEEENSSTSKITYNSKMETSAGNVEFSNIVRLNKNEEKGYSINWNSSLIYPQLSNTDKVRVKNITASRGIIYDKNGNMLAGTGTALSVGIVPGKLGENKEANIEKISELLEISTETINKALSASWVKEDIFVPLKKIGLAEKELKDELTQIPGVKINSTQTRTYPLGESAAQLIGYVQTATAEDIEKNPEKGYTETSLIGKAGLEKIFEDRLRGTDGIKIYIEDKEKNPKAIISEITVKNGENITLTIDSEIQKKLYNELKEDAGLFVVMHPKTGALSALVSTPSYDPNKFVLGMNTNEWNEIKNNPKNPMLARYLQSYCPGSTFKPITGAIGLTTGTLSENDTFTYSGLSWKKEGWGKYDITTLTPYEGPKNLRNALINSDNIYFAQATLKIGNKSFTSGLDKIKFEENIEFLMNITKSQYSNNGKISSEKLLADSGYGQGEILVNPIHMASIYSAFANDGNMIKPYLEKKADNTVEYLVENAFSKEAAKIIEEDLIQVVEDPKGTAKDMKISTRTIAGKTGTAELKDSKEDKADVLSWFDCFTTDTNNNQLLVISMVENGRDLGGSHYLIKKIKTLF